LKDGIHVDSTQSQLRMINMNDPYDIVCCDFHDMGVNRFHDGFRDSGLFFSRFLPIFKYHRVGGMLIVHLKVSQVRSVGRTLQSAVEALSPLYSGFHLLDFSSDATDRILVAKRIESDIYTATATEPASTSSIACSTTLKVGQCDQTGVAESSQHEMLCDEHRSLQSKAKRAASLNYPTSCCEADPCISIADTQVNGVWLCLDHCIEAEPDDKTIEIHEGVRIRACSLADCNGHIGLCRQEEDGRLLCWMHQAHVGEECHAQGCDENLGLRPLHRGMWCPQHYPEIDALRRKLEDAKRSCMFKDEIHYRQLEMLLRKHTDEGHKYRLRELQRHVG